MAENQPLIIQADKTLLLDTHHPLFDEVRRRIIVFSELVKTPEHIHFYRITPISLWNSAANGVSLEEILSTLETYKKYDIPKNVPEYIERHYTVYGKIVLERLSPEKLLLKIGDEKLRERVKTLLDGQKAEETPEGFMIGAELRGEVKTLLIKHLLPVKDMAGFESGNRMEFSKRDIALSGKPFYLRYYQEEAAANFQKWKEGSGVVILPCGAGKTIVGIGVMEQIQEYTLIITTSVEAIRQWRREILDKTTLSPDDVGEYTAQKKELKPVTITTYNMLVHKNSKTEEIRNIGLFTERNWGLIVYDEVHILPAPVFRMTTIIQSKRRLGLTATLVREDNLESEVFTLIGPKIYEYSWKALEKEGWIAQAMCYEIRVPLSPEDSSNYMNVGQRIKFRIASENTRKIQILKRLLAEYRNHHVLVIGHFLSQLEEVSRLFSIPLITGETPNVDRETLYQEFRSGKIHALAVSRVGNFSIDLPLADVAVQISGIFGSRQEEAQRLGRVLRPQAGKSRFFTLVSKDTIEEEFSKKRQLFLLEQGYQYSVVDSAGVEDLMVCSRPVCADSGLAVQAG